MHTQIITCKCVFWSINDIVRLRYFYQKYTQIARISSYIHFSTRFASICLYNDIVHNEGETHETTEYTPAPKRLHTYGSLTNVIVLIVQSLIGNISVLYWLLLILLPLIDYILDIHEMMEKKKNCKRQPKAKNGLQKLYFKLNENIECDTNHRLNWPITIYMGMESYRKTLRYLKLAVLAGLLAIFLSCSLIRSFHSF